MLKFRRSGKTGVLLLLAILMAPINTFAMTCYKIHDGAGRLLYRAPISPVNLAGDISKQLQGRWGNGRITWMESPFCDSLEDLPASAAAPPTTISTRPVVAPVAYPARERQSEGGATMRPFDAAAIISAPEMMSPVLGTGRGSNYEGGSGSPGSSAISGGDVKVRAYTRKDGTPVRAHTRAAPGRGKR